MNFDFSSIVNQIISYMTGLFATFSKGGLSENSVIQTIVEYANGVIENFSEAGFDVAELKEEVTSGIINNFKGTEYEDLANKAANKTGNDTQTSYSYNRPSVPTVLTEHPLFEFNGVDYTKYIEAPTWRINATDIYEEKPNADKRFIRTVSRSRITGTFKMVIDDPAVYAKFVSDAWNKKGSCGEITVNIWVNNKLNYETGARVYMTFEHRYEVPLMGYKALEGMEITIEEY